MRKDASRGHQKTKIFFRSSVFLLISADSRTSLKRSRTHKAWPTLELRAAVSRSAPATQKIKTAKDD
jgi:hypothetical protein